MKKLAYLILFSLLITSCNSKIKESEKTINIEEGTEVASQITPSKRQNKTSVKTENKLLGFWVGYFKEDDSENNEGQPMYVDEGFNWNRENKINISIDHISDSIVIGHSVVAGNNRPFKGYVHHGQFEVKEPGDDKYDGTFKFGQIGEKLVGTWSAYKNINIKYRKYELEKMEFTYNPNIMLEQVRAYIDWNKFIEQKTMEEYEEGEFDEWVTQEFASATPLIYSINASNTLLKKGTIENLKKGDLTIIRNTIYARHGYSFKNRPLRIFFDAQPWYIPVHTDIKSDFTAIEKQNIKLLLIYEKNALEYYDYFGRG
ncbi:YARHG domain-containing protein [Psychroserpens sp. NJDZ02]|uniref:YARHG domain-containing protein n=1 Tax=Psychroserpens sp. NJDZ02 TaxID=2570561 RepID=UPI0010A865C6|nr:YARHG domain-containing protein [Psychroserpens sp. NJDZ02]QCE42254.1 YARHG domain-containing protein [Psychroserpens sp. NJDZ02]